MAVNAKFIADFASFYDAVTKAELSLKGFETGAGNVEKSLNKMGNSFSGTKIIQDAHLMTAAMVQAGGMTTLTDKELRKLGATVGEASDKMRRLGIEVPPGFQRISDAADKIGTSARGSTTLLSGMATQLAGMFTIGAAVAFGREILNAGDAIKKMADQTGLTYDQVQRLEYIAGQTGVSMSTLVSAIQNLQQRLGDENTGAAGAMKTLGINADAFNKLNTFEQVLQLSTALQSETDVNERASLGAALFGKTWKEVGPAITANMKEIGDQAPKMADATVDALDRTGDAMLRAKAQAISWGAGIVTAIEQVGFEFGNALSIFNPAHFGKSTAEILKMQVALNNGPNGLAGALRNVQPHAKAAIGDIAKFGMSAEDTDKAIKDLNAKINASIPINDAATKKVEAARLVQVKWTKDMTDHNFMMTKWSQTMLHEAIPSLGTLTDRLDTMDGVLYEGVRDMNLMSFSIDRLGNVAQTAGGAFKGLSGMTRTFEVGAKDSTKATTVWTVSLGTLSQTFAQLAQTSGSAMGTIARTIGTVLTSMELAGQAGSKFKDSLDMVRGKGEGSKADGYVGLAVGALAAAAAIDAATNSTSKTSNIIGGAVAGAKAGAAAFGFYGAAVGAVAGALVGLAKSNSLEARTVSPLRDEFFRMAGGLEKLNPLVMGLTGNLKLVQAVFAADTVMKYNAALQELEAAFKFQSDALHTLDETAKKYNITIEEMGPAWQRQEMDKKALELFQDFQILNAAGVDHVLVLERMGESINAYIQKALQMGVEVPAAMRPMLEDMVKQGLLTDAAGNKITNLEDAGISFAITMSEGFKSLIAVVTKLTDAISRGLGLAIENIPDPEITGTVHWDVDNVPHPDGFNADGASTGGLVTATGIQHFSGGGRVLPFPRRGTDTVPAMLTPGEMVLNANQQKAVGALMSGGRDIVIHLTSELEGRPVARTVTRIQNQDHRLGRKVRAV